MRRFFFFLTLAGVILPAVAPAQTHGVAKPQTVVRAVGVYEWTGEEGKATASRFVPVSLFIDNQLQDAGVYLARPVPFALLTGTVFEVRKAGVEEGLLELAYARHLVPSGNGSYDDGWLAVGAFKPRPKEVLVAAKKSGPLPKIEVGGGTRPHFANKTDTPDASSKDTSGKTDASGKPVDRSGAAGSGTTVSAQDDADHPTTPKRSDADAAATTDDDKDVDRPTLRRRTPAQTRAQDKIKQQASVTGGGDLNDDPDRPNLHRGKPVTRLEEDDLPPLHGIPRDMHQRVAVSDARDRQEHDFARSWESEDEHQEVLGKMREIAWAQLAGYGGASAAPLSAPAPAPVRRRTGAKHKAIPAPAVAPVPALNDEDLRGYTLSYGGAATYEFQASSPAADGTVRYVTVVAQKDALGNLKLALGKVTDAGHLDRTPWFRLVDVVDVEASNRASLLFELRGQATRQFALYRVIGAQAEQVFVTYPAE